jgi:hypothetical protein
MASAPGRWAYQESRLDNGLRILTLEDHRSPLVSVQVWFHVGSKDEDPKRQGFAHMFEHMMFRGTDRIGPQDHFRYLNRYGARVNGYTSFDETVYWEVLPASQLDLALWLEAERLAHLKINEEYFAAERNVVKEERRMRYLNRPYGKLYETLCGAALWFDGLFGERNEIATAAARGTSGRFEISGLNSDYEGTKFRVRGNVRFDFPNFDRRWNAFLGRDDQDDFIRDRTEGLALRSQFLDFADENRWLAGLGYSRPGTYKQRTDFRVGGKLGSEPEVFVQGRHRRNFCINDRNLFHFRETIFWTNRDGFGSTTSLDFDHVVKRTMLLRWGNIGTVSEATEGLDWRSAILLYQSLHNAKALAYEIFIRGETANEVPLKEWGARTIYRQPLLHRDWLAGEVVLGYSWPRFELEDKREGSLTVGLGLEILVGGWR